MTGFRQQPDHRQQAVAVAVDLFVRGTDRDGDKHITTTSTRLLYLVLYIGLVIFGLSIALILFYLARYFTSGIGVDGFTSVIISIWFLGGLITLDPRHPRDLHRQHHGRNQATAVHDHPPRLQVVRRRTRPSPRSRRCRAAESTSKGRTNGSGLPTYALRAKLAVPHRIQIRSRRSCCRYRQATAGRDGETMPEAGHLAVPADRRAISPYSRSRRVQLTPSSLVAAPIR